MAFVSVVALVILVAAATWKLGSFVLRAVGMLLIVSTLVGELYAPRVIFGLVGMAVGLALWLAGHWLYAFRHHVYRGTLAQRIFLQVLPERLDPTRGWSVWP
jgi:hypothetical protein